MIRKLSALLLCLFVFAAAARAEDEDDLNRLSVMTQNMDAGTDLTLVIGQLLGYFPAGVGVELTYDEVQSSGIPQRAALLASKIAEKKPTLLALQEATLWRTGSSVDTATTVLYDQLQLLLSDLAADGVPYTIVAVNSLSDLALPKASGGALRITDRDALLVRADLHRPAFHLSNVQSDTYDAMYSLGGFEVPRGYISAIAHMRGREFRIFMTHLQGAVSGDPTGAAVQAAQTTELIHQMRSSNLPLVLAGDFNSDAIYGVLGPGPDNTSAAATIEAAGYKDTWTLAGTGPGPTWPYFLEDHYPPPFNTLSTPFERIDLIFSRGLRVARVEHLVEPGTGDAAPLFASDHAGVLAVFDFTGGWEN